MAVKTINLARMIERKVQEVERKLTLGRVGPIGVLLLIWTVMMLLTTMERSLNRIFDAPRARPLVRRVMLYWSVITLCPLLLATGAYVSSRAKDVLIEMPVLGWLLSAAGWLTPVVVGLITLAAVYTLMTNTKVSFRAALGGAAITVPLWLVAKWAFGLYVAYLVGPTKVYGVLGLMPLFLIWVNISWWLFLFGAAIAHTVQDLPQLQAVADEEGFTATPADALAVALTVARQFESGKDPVRAVDVAGELRLPTKPVEEVLDGLRRAGVVGRLDAEGDRFYVLTRPPGNIPMVDVLQLGKSDESIESAARYHGEIAQAIASAARRTRGALGDYTLGDVLIENAPRQPE